MSIQTASFAATGRDLGLAIGERFAASIRGAVLDNATLQGPMLAFHRTEHGQALFARLVAMHEHHFPTFVDEIRAMAEAAAVNFDELMIVNLRGEYRGYTGIDDLGECSTCALVDDDNVVFGHNEDGSAIYQGRSYFIDVNAPDARAFQALCYPGFLPGNAFGFNASGVCFSVNNVRPREVREGLGRHFFARSLFTARSLDEALALLRVGPRAGGFNYTLASRVEQCILNVEVSPTQVDVREIKGVHFHANHYLYLQVEQHRFASSVSRQQRGELLLATDAPGNHMDVLRVLQDQDNTAASHGLPIWRDGTPPDEGVTLLSAVFDLGAGVLSLYPGPGDAGAEPHTALLSVPIAPTSNDGSAVR